MDPREREKAVFTGGIAAAIVIIIAIFAGQVMSKQDQLRSSIAGKQRALNEIKESAVEYSKALARAREIRARMSDTSPLLSYLENLSRQAGIQDAALKVMRTTPSEYFEESAVELKAQNLNLRQVTTLLNLIETSPRFLKVKYFHLKTPYAHPELLNLTMQVSAYYKKEEKGPGQGKEEEK